MATLVIYLFNATILSIAKKETKKKKQRRDIILDISSENSKDNKETEKLTEIWAQEAKRINEDKKAKRKGK